MSNNLLKSLIAKHVTEVANSPMAKISIWSESKIYARAHELATSELITILSAKVEQLETMVAEQEAENESLRREVVELKVENNELFELNGCIRDTNANLRDRISQLEEGTPADNGNN